jgi:hypothetical protein
LKNRLTVRRAGSIFRTFSLSPVTSSRSSSLERAQWAYADYSDRVPRFLPRFATWHDVDELTTKPAVVVRTFRDSCLFLLAIPIAQTIDWAQQVGYLPILLRLP